MDLQHLSIGDAALVSLVGFLTVFTILLIISLLIRFMSYVIQLLEHRGGKADAAPAGAKAEDSSSSAPDDRDEETVAAIMAAVAAAMGTSPDRLILRDIKPAQVYTPTWGLSARTENMEELSWQ